MLSHCYFQQWAVPLFSTSPFPSLCALYLWSSTCWLINCCATWMENTGSLIKGFDEQRQCCWLVLQFVPQQEQSQVNRFFESQTLLWRVQRLGRWGWKGKLPGLCPAGTAEQCWVVLRVRTAVLPPPHLVLLLTWRWKNHGLNELSGFRWPAFHPPLSSWSCGVWLGLCVQSGFFQEFSWVQPCFLLCCCSWVSSGDAAAPSPALWLPGQQQPHLPVPHWGPDLSTVPAQTPSLVCFSIQFCDNLAFGLTVSTENTCMLWVS